MICRVILFFMLFLIISCNSKKIIQNEKIDSIRIEYIKESNICEIVDESQIKDVINLLGYGRSKSVIMGGDIRITFAFKSKNRTMMLSENNFIKYEHETYMLSKKAFNRILTILNNCE